MFRKTFPWVRFIFLNGHHLVSPLRGTSHIINAINVYIAMHFQPMAVRRPVLTKSPHVTRISPRWGGSVVGAEGGASARCVEACCLARWPIWPLLGGFAPLLGGFAQARGSPQGPRAREGTSSRTPRWEAWARGRSRHGPRSRSKLALNPASTARVPEDTRDRDGSPGSRNENQPRS